MLSIDLTRPHSPKGSVWGAKCSSPYSVKTGLILSQNSLKTLFCYKIINTNSFCYKINMTRYFCYKNCPDQFHSVTKSYFVTKFVLQKFLLSPNVFCYQMISFVSQKWFGYKWTTQNHLPYFILLQNSFCYKMFITKLFCPFLFGNKIHSVTKWTLQNNFVHSNFVTKFIPLPNKHDKIILSIFIL